MDRHHVLLSEETVKVRDRAGIASLPKFDPEDDKTGMGIASAHILDEFGLRLGMLVRVRMRTSGPISEGIPGAVITVFPAVNILTVGFIFNSRVRNPILFSVFN